MKNCTIFRSKRYGPTKKVVLVLCLTGSGVVATLPVAWAYKKINLGFGMEAAQVTMAMHVSEILVMTAVAIETRPAR